MHLLLEKMNNSISFFKCRNSYGYKTSISRIRKGLDMLFLLCFFLSIYSGFLYLTKVVEIYSSGLFAKVAYIIYFYQSYVYVLIAVVKTILEFYADRKRAILFFVLLILAFVHKIFSQYSLINIYEVVVMAIAANRVKFSKIAILFFAEECILTISTIMLATVNIIPNEVLYVADGRVCTYLGFGSHNVLMIIVFFNSLILLYLNRAKKVFYKESTLLFIVGFAVYRFTASRTSFYMLILCLLGIIFISIINKTAKIDVRTRMYCKVEFCAIFMPIICSILSFLGMITWNYFAKDAIVDEIWQMKGPYILWNNTMTNRFRDASINFAANGFILPWENPTMKLIRETEGFKYNWLFGGGWCSQDFDNIYMCAFITAGVVVFVLLLVYMTYLAYRAYKTNDIIVGWIFACIAIFAIMEGLKYLVYNPFLLILFSDWELKEKEKYNET